MGKINSKKKGNRVEREFAKLLSERFDDTFRRVPASGAHGTNLADTGIREDAKEILTGDLICPKWFNFTVEVKSRADFNFWDLLNRETKNEIDEWIGQAEGEAKVAKKDWFVIVKVNNRKPFVIIERYYDIDEKNIMLKYKHDYALIRWDYFMELPDEFFGKTESM
jgi:Holliday junction resolvase